MKPGVMQTVCVAKIWQTCYDGIVKDGVKSTKR